MLTSYLLLAEETPRLQAVTCDIYMRLQVTWCWSRRPWGHARARLRC